MQSSEIPTLAVSRKREVQSCFLSILFSLFFLASWVADPVQSFAENTISGTVSLAAGHVAPSGGMNIRLSVYDINSSQQTDNSSSAFINEGETSAGYSLTVPQDSDADWWVRYYYWGDEPYVQEGFYNSTGTTWELRLTLLDGGTDHNSINLSLLTGNNITGTVSLPAGYAAPPGGVNIHLSARNREGYWYSTSGFVFIDEGGKSVGYSLTVPPDPDASWEVSYSYWGSLLKVIETGCYNSTATTLESAQATLLAGAEDHSGINMKLHTTEDLVRTTKGLVRKSSWFMGGPLLLLLER